MTKEMLTIRYQGREINFPVEHGTQGSPVVDIRQLHDKTGLFTYDPGFMSTGSCRSAITFIDSEQGELLYRGYPIEQLAKRSNYLETCYLLLHGELPNSKENVQFEATIKQHSMVHEGMKRFISGFHHDAHPMAIMLSTVGALSAFYHDSLDINDPAHRELSAYRMIAKMPTIAAYSYKHSLGLPFIYPLNKLRYSENFLHMMFAVPAEKYEPQPDFVAALDLILLLHADHEQNASTSTVRLSSSSGANPFASIAAGMASLWGPAHGGANEAVIKMLLQILDSGESVESVIERAKKPHNNFRLMGFGHRVYRNFDPRAKIIKEMCHRLLKDSKQDDAPLFDMALQLEDIALNDPYFIERKLYPNVDFYSGIILRALGIPLNMYTVIFAMARTVGWISHWMEMMQDPDLRIGRPRQLYIGAKPRDYLPMGKRKKASKSALMP